MKNTVEERELKCVLNDEEILRYSRELAKKNQDKDDAEQAKKCVIADYKDKIESFTASIGLLARKISSGYEHRPVKCTWAYDYEKGKKTLFRDDTCERVDTADITPYERQQHLGLDGGPDEEVSAEEPHTPEPTRTTRGRKPRATA